MNPQGLPIARSMLLIPTDPSPDWFNHLLARDPQIVHLDLPPPFARYGSIFLSTDLMTRSMKPGAIFRSHSLS